MIRQICRATPSAVRLTLGTRSLSKWTRLRARRNAEPNPSNYGPPLLTGKNHRESSPPPLKQSSPPVVDITERREVANSDSEDEEWLETLKEGLQDLGIDLPRFEPGTHRILCPECEGGTTGEISLSVTIDDSNRHALYHCFRATCEWAGVLHSEFSKGRSTKPPPRKVTTPKKPKPNFQPLDEDCWKFFKDRGISEEVVNRNGIMMEIKAGHKFIAFPYTENGELVNVKYRMLEKKNFHQITGGAKVFYGLDDIKDSDEEVIIVEGEMDKLALEVAGFLNVVSVPDGAPGKVKDKPSADDKKFSYLHNCEKLFNVKRIVMATDNDDPGKALAEELARRFGTWRFSDMQQQKFEEAEKQDDARWFRKDANDVLSRDGADFLKAYIDLKEAYPLPGLVTFNDYAEEIVDRYMLSSLCPSGHSTGWKGIDKYYRVVPGELTIVSGVPNSGKSEWLDALAVNMAEMYGWRIAFAAMEKTVAEHARQLIEKHVRKPFFDRVEYAKGTKRMNSDQMLNGLTWISGQFPLIRDESDQLPTADWILETAALAVRRYGILGLVIDPYNEISHRRPGGTTETEFVSEMLTKIKRFARAYKVHVWLVAHPRQLHDWRGEPPNLYDISGSAHFVNKADAGIVVHRNWTRFQERLRGRPGEVAIDEEDQYKVTIKVLKMRTKTAGRIGEHVLKYNPVDGTYSDPPPPSEPFR